MDVVVNFERIKTRLTNGFSKKWFNLKWAYAGTVRALQFLQAAYFAEQMHARDGEWVDESCVEHSGIDYE